MKVNNKTTNYFKYEKGVPQGNPLSPILFNLYVNDIFGTIVNQNPVSLDDTHNFNALMYVDDLIIFSTTTDGLQKGLDSLSDYCGKWKLDINYTKTKCMTFTEGNTKEKNNFAINNQIIENVKEFKYLGIAINRKGSFKPTLEDLSCKGSRALYAIASKIHLKDTPIKTMIKIFDSCIAPILLYGSEICAPYITHDYTKWESTPIERIHTQYLKRLLGVNRSTTNILVREQTGRNPLLASTLTRNINYIKYLNNKCNSTLVKQALDYETSKKDNRQTILSLVQIHENTLTLQIANNDDIWTISKYKLSKAVYEEFNSLLQGQIPLYTKAATYKLFKDRIKFENDLTNIKNRKQRVTKLRLSDHNLLIEEGRRRRPRIPREERLCPLCSQEVGNEIHFLITSDAYTEKFELFNQLSTTVPVLFNLDNISKFTFPMSQEGIITTKLLVSQVSKMTEERVGLIQQQLI